VAVKKRFGRKKDFKVRRERDYSHQREPAISPFFRPEVLVQVEIFEIIAFIRVFIEYFTHQRHSSYACSPPSPWEISLGPMRGPGVGEKKRGPGAVPEWQLVKSVEWIGLVGKRIREKKQRVEK